MIAARAEGPATAGQHQAATEVLGPLGDGLHRRMPQPIRRDLFQHQHRHPGEFREPHRTFGPGADAHTGGCQGARQIARFAVASDHQHLFTAGHA